MKKIVAIIFLCLMPAMSVLAIDNRPLLTRDKVLKLNLEDFIFPPMVDQQRRLSFLGSTLIVTIENRHGYSEEREFIFSGRTFRPDEEDVNELLISLANKHYLNPRDTYIDTIKLTYNIIWIKNDNRHPHIDVYEVPNILDPMANCITPFSKDESQFLTTATSYLSFNLRNGRLICDNASAL